MTRPIGERFKLDEQVVCYDHENAEPLLHYVERDDGGSLVVLKCEQEFFEDEIEWLNPEKQVPRAFGTCWTCYSEYMK